MYFSFIMCAIVDIIAYTAYTKTNACTVDETFLVAKFE